jgi:HEAT repeat protein
MSDPSGDRLVYWPRSWAARALAYAGDVSVTPVLVMATTDQHWRVRMTAVRTLGRLGAAGVSDALKAAVDDEHPRVRAAAELALHRLE